MYKIDGGGGQRVKKGCHKIGAWAEIGQNGIRGGGGVQKFLKLWDIIYVCSLTSVFGVIHKIYDKWILIWRFLLMGLWLPKFCDKTIGHQFGLKNSLKSVSFSYVSFSNYKEYNFCHSLVTTTKWVELQVWFSDDLQKENGSLRLIYL